MDPIEAEAAAVMRRAFAQIGLRQLPEIMAEIRQLPPAGQCAVLDHDYPRVWTVGSDQGSSGPAALYYSRTCPRCGSVEVTDGRSWLP